jgi:hypothetical protein
VGVLREEAQVVMRLVRTTTDVVESELLFSVFAEACGPFIGGDTKGKGRSAVFFSPLVFGCSRQLTSSPLPLQRNKSRKITHPKPHDTAHQDYFDFLPPFTLTEQLRWNVDGSQDVVSDLDALQ